MIDGRPLAARVRALARRFDAQASGVRKREAESVQVAENLERDARTLHDAADRLEAT